jgi:hypothetical protein
MYIEHRCTSSIGDIKRTLTQPNAPALRLDVTQLRIVIAQVGSGELGDREAGYSAIASCPRLPRHVPQHPYRCAVLIRDWHRRVSLLPIGPKYQAA